MLYLASQSPRRQELIKKITLNFMPVTIDAEEITTGINHKQLALANAHLKASAAFEKFKQTVLGSDTVVSYEGKLFLKPKDEDDAFNMIRLLSGKTHFVYTGVCVISNKGVFKDVKKSFVTLNDLTDEKITEYIKTDLWKGKAGSYGVQDKCGIVKSYRGGIDNIMGLPVDLTKKLLIESGFIL